MWKMVNEMFFQATGINRPIHFDFVGNPSTNVNKSQPYQGRIYRKAAVKLGLEDIFHDTQIEPVASY